MWFLTSDNDPRVLYFTPDKVKLTVGRSTDPEICDFSVLEDTSISRKHATLSASGDDLVLVDLDSKYGTFLQQPGAQKAKVSNDSPQILQEGAIVTFGAYHCIWKVNRIYLNSAASTLKGENLQSLKSIVGRLGGTFKNEWDEKCTFLTMPAITLTVKVVLALVQGSHIVTLQFWQNCHEAITKRAQLPSPSDFLPQVIESTLNKEIVSFLPDARRKAIFAGKTFVFLARRQLDMYKNVISMGSGSPVLLSEAKLTKAVLATPNVIVVQYIPNNTSQNMQPLLDQINNIVSYLKTKGRRVVADAEIGLAILYCSLKKYCNPDFNFSSEVMKATDQSQNLYPGSVNVLAQESEDSVRSSLPHKNVVIQESLVSMINDDTYTSSKRKLDNEDGMTENAQKKVATESIVNNFSNDNDSENIFNFVHEEPNVNKINDNNTNRLNFSKPQKRKEHPTEDDDDQLFNFISSNDYPESSTEQTPQSKNIFDGSRVIKEEPFVQQAKRPKVEYTEDDFKVEYKPLKDLLANATTWKSSDEIIDLDIVKKEDITEELERKVASLALGTTVVTIKEELIVESKTPVVVELPNGNVKNFKKFKKVWPVKMQVTIIPKTAMSVVKPDGSVIGDLAASDSEDEVIINGASAPKKMRTEKITDFFNKN